MKKALCLCAIVCLLLSTFGCAFNDASENSAVFYYLQNSPTYGNQESLIAPETRELPKEGMDVSSIMALYLNGPKDTVEYDFIYGIVFIGMQLQDGCAELVLGGTYNTMGGLNKTLACACITLTVCELTGAKQVKIRSERDAPDSEKAITMTPESILLFDSCQKEIEPN